MKPNLFLMYLGLTLACPMSIVTSSATVSWNAPTVSDAQTTVTCNPTSGSQFTVGTSTDVTCTTQTANPESCTFSVTVGMYVCVVCMYVIADRVIRFSPGHIHIIRLTGPVVSVCHWAPSRVHGDDGACSLYDGITLPVNCW